MYAIRSYYADLLRDLDLMKEKNLIQRFFKELIKDDGGLSAYGEAQVMKYLEMGAIDTLIRNNFV